MLQRLDALEAIAREAGALAVEAFGRVVPETKADGTVVTEADRAVQRLIVTRLRALEPDPRRLFIRGEEDVGGGDEPNPGVEDPAEAALVAAVDPIDGTASYAAGLPLWSVSIGLLQGARPVAGVVFVPLMGGPTGWLYRADPGGPATRNGAPIAPRPWEGWEAVRQVGVPSGLHRWARVTGYEGKLRSLGSTAHHLCLAAAGGLDALVIGRAHLWDLAAGAAILARAGGVLQYTDGGPPDWDALLYDRRPFRILTAGRAEAVAALGPRVEITWKPSTPATSGPADPSPAPSGPADPSPTPSPSPSPGPDPERP